MIEQLVANIRIYPLPPGEGWGEGERQLLDVVAIGHAVVAQDVAVVPEFFCNIRRTHFIFPRWAVMPFPDSELIPGCRQRLFYKVFHDQSAHIHGREYCVVR